MRVDIKWGALHAPLLLLGAAGSAAAADLPQRAAAPAEYVRVCTAYGSGFFYLPGTDVCLKVGGNARYQAEYAQPFSSSASAFGTRAQGRVDLDSRTATAYGTLRAFIRVDFAFRTGSARSGSAARQGYAFDNSAAPDAGINNRAQTHVLMDKAFIQWGGLIAGKTNSLFEYNKSTQIIGVLPSSNMTYGANILGYIATFGSGFYASLSAEDTVMRRQALTDPFNPGGTVSYYAGFRMPDVVAAIGVDQSWGSAQLSGVIHQIPVVGVGGANVNSEYGFGVLGGMTFNLPMIASGDFLWFTATYVKGATTYLHSDWNPLASNSASFGNSNSFYQADAYIDVLTNGVSKSSGWGVAAQFQHYWTPALRSAFFGGYSRFENPTVNNVKVADWDYWAAGANLIWSPIRSLDIGGELAYQRINGRGVQTLGGAPVAGAVASTALRNSDGAWSFKARVQRSF